VFVCCVSCHILFEHSQAAIQRDKCNFPKHGSNMDAAQRMNMDAPLRMNTRNLMEATVQKSTILLLCMPFCGFWLPLLFFLAASNVLDTCEADNFKLWLQLYGILPTASAFVLQVIVAVFACRGDSDAFKMGLRMQALPQLLSLCLLVWGWVEYSKTDKDKCVNPDDGINPRTLAIVFLIMASICSPCILCGICRQVNEPTGGASCGHRNEAQVFGSMA